MTLTPAQLALLIEAMDWRQTTAPPLPDRLPFMPTKGPFLTRSEAVRYSKTQSFALI
jgi:hypothetical protein